MSTTKNELDFRSALGSYHAALEKYQRAVAAIEDEGRVVQLHGRSNLARLDRAALDTGSRATCLVRETVSAQILLLDIESGAVPPEQNQHAIKVAVTTLEARITQLQLALSELEAARQALEHHLEAALDTARATKDKLHDCRLVGETDDDGQ